METDWTDLFRNVGLHPDMSELRAEIRDVLPIHDVSAQLPKVRDLVFMMGQPTLTPLFRSKHKLLMRSALDLPTIGNHGPGWNVALTQLPPHVQPAIQLHRSLAQGSPSCRFPLPQIDAHDEEYVAPQETFVLAKNVFLSFAVHTDPEGTAAGTRCRCTPLMPTIEIRARTRRVV